MGNTLINLSKGLRAYFVKKTKTQSDQYQTPLEQSHRARNHFFFFQEDNLGDKRKMKFS